MCLQCLGIWTSRDSWHERNPNFWASLYAELTILRAKSGWSCRATSGSCSRGMLLNQRNKNGKRWATDTNRKKIYEITSQWMRMKLCVLSRWMGSFYRHRICRSRSQFDIKNQQTNRFWASVLCIISRSLPQFSTRASHSRPCKQN